MEHSARNKKNGRLQSQAGVDFYGVPKREINYFELGKKTKMIIIMQIKPPLSFFLNDFPFIRLKKTINLYFRKNYGKIHSEHC